MTKHSMHSFFIVGVLTLTALIGNAANKLTAPEKGVVKGRVTDAQGKGIPNVKVVIENTVFYASYFFATTDTNGNYRTNVATGSWKASVRITSSFHGTTYLFDLHPDNAIAFAGTDGAVRNFTWKIEGAKEDGTGFYGSEIAVYNQPGSSLLMNEVEITLTPEGTLIDGNKGRQIISGLSDIGGGEDGVRDIPIGKYNITAKNKKSGKPLLVRLRNKGTFAQQLTSTFTSGFTGITNYKIVIQVQDKDEM
jgi:hypothetical protein